MNFTAQNLAIASQNATYLQIGISGISDQKIITTFSYLRSGKVEARKLKLISNFVSKTHSSGEKSFIPISARI
jgi:hypothetical protein